MKIRTGFVSNSSSSSFVIGKAHMTKEQIDEFYNALDDINYENCGQGYIESTKYYFVGTVSDHNSVLNDVINRLNLKEFVEYGD